MLGFRNKIFVLMCWIVLSIASAAEDPPKNIVDDWRFLEREYAVVNGIITELVNGEEIAKYIFAIQGSLGKSVTKKGVRLFNDLYSYSLVKSSSKEGQWTLAHVQSRDTDEVANNMSTYVRKNVCVGNVRLLDMVDSKLYAFGNWVQSNGKVIVQITFMTPEPRIFDSVDVEFDSNNHHRIARAVGAKQYPQGKRYTEYAYFYSNADLPDKVVATFSGAGSPAKLDYVYSDVSTIAKSDEEFTLKHFGLPEFVAPKSRNSSNYVYLICGCLLLCSVLALVLLKR